MFIVEEKYSKGWLNKGQYETTAAMAYALGLSPAKTRIKCDQMTKGQWHYLNEQYRVCIPKQY